jgi:hypothetical protein
MSEPTTIDAPTDVANSIFDASPSEPAVPQQSSTPAPTDSDAPISLEDFDSPTDLAPVTDAPGETETPEESATPEGEAEAPAEAPPTDVPKAGKRDYSRFPEEVQGKLKQMSNAAFEEYSKTFDAKVSLEAKVKELESKADPNKLPDNYYEHEEGYTLSPQYKEAAGVLTNAEKEAAFIRSQMDAYDQGNVVFEPGWVNGEVVPCVRVNGKLMQATSPEQGMQPTKAWEREMLTRLTRAENLKGEAVGRIGTLQQQFKTEHEAAKNIVLEGVKQLAPWSAKKDDPVNQWAQAYKAKAIPKIYQGHPLAESTAQATAWGLTQQKRAEALEAKVKALENSRSDARKAPPVPTRGKQASTTKETVFTLDSFK